MDDEIPPEIVADVIGAPETWPNYSRVSPGAKIDMRGARIIALEASEDGIAVTAKGVGCGRTYSVFAIADADLRTRTMRALKRGMDVHEAVRLHL